MSNIRSLAVATMATALAALLMVPAPARAAGQVDAQAMMLDTLIKISAAGAALGTICGATDSEIEQMKATQMQRLREQQGTLPEDFDRRFDAAIAARVAQAKQLSPMQRQQACQEFTQGLEQMADQTRKSTGDG